MWIMREMKILLTGSSGGIGQALSKRLRSHEITEVSRSTLDLGCIDQVLSYRTGNVDMLINCAGTDIGGKIDFVNHRDHMVAQILTVNLLAPVLLTQKVLKDNPQCRIVNITSTNNKRYYANNLAYSLSKLSLGNFGDMLAVDYPDIDLLEVRLGLTKTNFNTARYAEDSNRFVDIYTNQHLSADWAAEKIHSVLFDSTVKFIEISP
jgi:short-subunit dehydrogenase